MSNELSNSTETLSGAEELVGIFRAYITPVNAIFGILGNFLVIITFATDKQLSRFSIYSIILAIIHSITLLLNGLLDDFIGRGLAYVTNNEYFIKIDTYSDSLCTFMEYTPTVMYFSSSYIVIFFSIDRVVTIFSPLKYFSTYFKRVSVIACLLVILCGAILSIPAAIIFNMNGNSTDGVGDRKCEVTIRDGLIDEFTFFFNSIVTFVIPNIIVLILNIVICLKFHRIRVNRATLTSANVKDFSQEMNRVVGHLAVGTAFFFLTLPLVVLILLRQHASYNDWPDDANEVLKHLSRFTSSLKDVNYAIDFFLYLIFLPHFRKRALSILCYPCREYNLSCCQQQLEESNNTINNSGGGQGGGGKAINVAITRNQVKKSSDQNNRPLSRQQLSSNNGHAADSHWQDIDLRASPASFDHGVVVAEDEKIFKSTL